jgi:hypothetical protein
MAHRTRRRQTDRVHDRGSHRHGSKRRAKPWGKAGCPCQQCFGFHLGGNLGRCGIAAVPADDDHPPGRRSVDHGGAAVLSDSQAGKRLRGTICRTQRAGRGRNIAVCGAFDGAFRAGRHRQSGRRRHCDRARRTRRGVLDVGYRAVWHGARLCRRVALDPLPRTRGRRHLSRRADDLHPPRARAEMDAGSAAWWWRLRCSS